MLDDDPIEVPTAKDIQRLQSEVTQWVKTRPELKPWQAELKSWCTQLQRYVDTFCGPDRKATTDLSVHLAKAQRERDKLAESLDAAQKGWAIRQFRLMVARILGGEVGMCVHIWRASWAREQRKRFVNTLNDVQAEHSPQP